MRRIVSPYFLSHLLVSEANVSDVLFLGFHSVQRFLGTRSRARPPNRIPEQENFRAGFQGRLYGMTKQMDFRAVYTE